MTGLLFPVMIRIPVIPVFFLTAFTARSPAVYHLRVVTGMGQWGDSCNNFQRHFLIRSSDRKKFRNIMGRPENSKKIPKRKM
jgi:hypothetical protein